MKLLLVKVGSAAQAGKVAKVAIVAFSACFALPVLAADTTDVEETLSRAAQIHAEALALEHGWSVTQPFIDEARAALEAGDLETAVEVADRALLTAEQSLEQAREEADAWQDRVLGS